MQKLLTNKKIFIVLTIIVLILLGVQLITYVQLNKFQTESNKMVLLSTDIKYFVLVEANHVEWTNEISNYLFNKNIERFHVTLDGHHCAFGRLLYSDRRIELEERIPDIKFNLSNIEPLHLSLHKTAEEITILMLKGEWNRAEAIKIYRENTLPLLIAIQKELENIIQSINQKVNEHYYIIKQANIYTQQISIATSIIFIIILAGVLLFLYMIIFFINKNWT